MRCIVKLLGVLAVLLSLNSCTVYYYSVLDSGNAGLIKNVDNDFVDEDDSVLVAYCFYGENAPVRITVLNKTDEPLYVDWGSSALIIDDVAVSYEVKNSTYVVTSNYGTSVHVTSNERPSNYGDVPGSAQFVPPHSKIEFASLRLGNFTFENIPKKQFRKQPFYTKDGVERKVYVKKYNEVVSPVRFRSYLTLLRKDKENNKIIPFVREHDFYVSEVIRAGDISPKHFLAGAYEQGDFFYVTREQGTGFAVAGIVALSIAGAVIADEAAIRY